MTRIGRMGADFFEMQITQIVPAEFIRRLLWETR